MLASLLAWRGRRATAAVLCVALFVSACATYAPRPGEPGDVLAREHSHAVRVALRDGRTVEVLEPALRVDGTAAGGADTVLAGFVFDAREGRRVPVALALRDVVSVSARIADHRANGALVIGTGLLVATLAALFVWIVAGCKRSPVRCD